MIRSDLHPQAPTAVAGAETSALRLGDGVLLLPAAGLHQRAQSRGQLSGHGPPPLRHPPLHAGRVRPRAGEQPQTRITSTPAPREAQCPQNEGEHDEDYVKVDDNGKKC